MKVFVATKQGQGERSNDFSWTEEGEVVGFSSECDHEKVDGKCGCRRSMSGLTSRKGTTTFKVADVDLTDAQVLDLFAKSLEDMAEWMDESEFNQMIEAEAIEVIRLASHFETGSVLEKRGTKFQVRIHAPKPTIN